METYYKALDPNLKSLGLKRAVPIQYKIGEWVKPRETPDCGEYTKGGLWVGKHPGFIRWIIKYMQEKYGRDVVIYTCKIGRVLWESCNRIKTDRVMLLEEVIWR